MVFSEAYLSEAAALQTQLALCTVGVGCSVHVSAFVITQSVLCVCRARRRRVLSQFDDLQQCYLRLRKAGKTAAPHLVPSLPSKHASQASASEDQPSKKRMKQEASPQPEPLVPADSLAGLDPLSTAEGREATPVDTPSSSAQPQVASYKPQTSAFL